MNWLLVYISPNNTTRKITEQLGMLLSKNGQVQKLDLGKYWEIEKIDLSLFQDIDVIGFGSPVYHFRMLEPITIFIEKMLPKIQSINKNLFAFLYVTYGGITSGKALLNAASQLNEKGVNVLGAMKVVAPHVGKDDATYPNEKTIVFLKDFTQHLTKRMDNPISWESLKKELTYQKGIVKPIYPFSKLIAKFRKLPMDVDKSLCSKCQLCYKKCPVGAIQMEDGYPVQNKEKCLPCYHCVVICPKKALTADLKKLKAMVAKNEKIVGREQPQNFFY